MITGNGILDTLVVAFANYYITTFSIWFGHWFSHLKRSPLASFHVSGHHVIYLNSDNLLSEVFRYGSGRQDSSFALIPPLMLQATLQYTFLPLWVFLICLVQMVSIASAIGYIHTQIHIRGSQIERFHWFLMARHIHAFHHDIDGNYMVADHFWDKVFGTYVQRKTVRVKAMENALGP